jgi:hypothetical protein
MIPTHGALRMNDIDSSPDGVAAAVVLAVLIR